MENKSRGLLGILFKWAFIVFNVMMAIMMYLSMGHTEESNTAVKVGADMGITMVGMMWLSGFIVLGTLTYFTRAK